MVRFNGHNTVEDGCTDRVEKEERRRRTGRYGTIQGMR